MVEVRGLAQSSRLFRVFDVGDPVRSSRPFRVIDVKIWFMFHAKMMAGVDMMTVTPTACISDWTSDGRIHLQIMGKIHQPSYSTSPEES